ncbi:intermediate filament protein-like protein [Microthyrium microscopicum]|uniref:Intermediate filament protein-like protein n=1 Tax=Microthyrium microscopicum TaxID=703497 RepID=A0A6A6UA56_9PEZI|nr:intermediate filament protein-like protein [Microthyrium microscopicum]
MELSRRDVILSAVAVFIAWGYLTHWLPSLRFLPYAFLAGALFVLLAGLWIVLTNSRPLEVDDSLQRYGSRNVAFVAPSAWKKEVASWRARSATQPKPIYPPSLPVSHSFDKLLSLVLRDFVVSWYSQISKRAAFKNEVAKVTRESLGNILDRLLDLDLVGAVVSRIIPILTTHMKDFYEAERAVRGKKLTRNITESEDLDLAIAAKFRNGNLHKAASLGAADSKMVQQQYLRSVVMRLLPLIMPVDALTSTAVTVLVKEIVACAVLAPAMKLLADPDTWHQLLENYGRTILQERKNIRKLRAALEEHAPQTPKAIKQTPFPKIHPNDNERKYERFIRAIRQCHTLSDARRFRSEVAIQLRKESDVSGQDPLYLRRLETGKRMLDQRISQLGAAGSSTQKGALPVQAVKRSTQLETTTLREILYNASGLSYFMEFMERRHLMRLVQFWIVVDGFRNPLEDENDQATPVNSTSITWTPADRQDIAQINEGYLTKPEIKISPLAHEDVKAFLRAGKTATNAQYQAARRAVLLTQGTAYDEMLDNYFLNFKKSDLWYKFLAAEDAIARPLSPLGNHTSNSQHTNSHNDHPPTRPKPPRAVHTSKDLRRAVASSADLKGAAIRHVEEANGRRSFDSSSSTSRAPLFDDDVDNEPMANSTASLDSDVDAPTNGHEQAPEDPRVVDAMQAALTDIMGSKPEPDALFSPVDDDSMRGSMELPRPHSGSHKSASNLFKDKPSIASLGLVEAPGRRGVFEDDLFAEETKFPEDDKEDPDPPLPQDEDTIHEAAPGDLGLAEAIDALTLDIEKLVTQESIVDSLTKKAELTNNAAELRILRKSKSSLQREISRKELQRQQYIVQESDNSLFGRANISIKNIMIGAEADGREFAMYIIEVARQSSAGEQIPSAVWVVTRRYSEFHELNKRLRSRYPQIKSLDFPRRQMPVLKLQKDFLEKRRGSLERYLRALLQVPAICRSRELRSFLSQHSLPTVGEQRSDEDSSRDFVSRIYSSVTDGMEEFLGNIPVLDQLSVAGQNLISAATSQLNATNTPAGTGAGIEELRASAEAEAEIAAFETKELEPFVKPICDLFLELFELNRENNWLRGRAVVLVLHQLLGGAVERKVRDSARTVLSPEGLTKTIDSITDLLWPGGGPRITPKTRSTADKALSRKEAGVVLASLVPELVGSVVGRANAHGAARRLLAMLNNERLK